MHWVDDLVIDMLFFSVIKPHGAVDTAQGWRLGLGGMCQGLQIHIYIHTHNINEPWTCATSKELAKSCTP